MTPALTPARILETATAFWPSKVLLSAIELGVFTQLATKQMNNAALAAAVGIRADRSPDFFDTLVSIGFLQREGNGPNSVYSNTPESDVFLDRAKPSYAGGMPEMLNARLFGFWGGLTEALRTGAPQNELKGSKESNPFAMIYSDPARLEGFLGAMSSIQFGNFTVLANAFDFSKHSKVLDLGGANALFSRIVAARHPHLSLTSFDLPPVQPVAKREIEKAGLASRVEAVAGDFFKDAWPKADVMVMGNILHDWSLEHKQALIRKAFASLPAGGVFIAIENVIDDARRQNAFGLMMSLNMLIETGAQGGFDYTGAQFDGWCREAGFSKTTVMPLAGPASAAIAWK